MKKTFPININGFIFHIDEDAYEILSKYLNEINRKFANSDEGREIISDIEARIAELFHERLSDAKQVITISDVESVIAIMGKPEDMGDDESEKEQDTGKKRKYRTGKRIYRDPDNAKIAGVGAGIAAYFAIDPVIARILLLITFFMSGPIIYIILWIVMPPAKTTAEKLEMKGEKINVENIERTIKDEFKNVKKNIRNFRRKGKYDESRNVLDRLLALVFGVVSTIVRVIMILLGVVFVIAGLFILIGIIGSFFIDSWGINNLAIPDVMQIFFDKMNINLALISLLLVIGIPVLAIMYWGIKMIFRIKAKSRIAGFTAFFAWIIGVIILAYISMHEVKNHQTSTNITETMQIDSIPSETLYLQLNDNTIEGKNNFNKLNIDNVFIVDNINDKIHLRGLPRIKIKRNDSDKIELKIAKHSRGIEKDVAGEHAKEIVYNWNVKDSLIIFDKYFDIENDNKWYNQQVLLTLYIPEGQELEIDDKLQKLLKSHYDISIIYDGEKYSNKYIMHYDGLEIFE